MIAPFEGGGSDQPAADADASCGRPLQASADQNVLVLGAGNILLSDEGVGVRVVETLQQRFRMPPGVEVLDGGTCGMDLLDAIAGRDLLIIVDAVNTGRPPGTVVRYADQEIPVVFRTKSSPHQLGLADVLALLSLLDSAPRRVTVIGVVPESLDIGLGLTPTIAARTEEMLDLVVAELAACGVAPVPIAHAQVADGS